ncbi:MAG TPA: bifunctional UDP-sugar hydrolase/5'-nucleotidase [Erysipelothrix sp.]|nr:bifunctional UDP-sugar hydrolase/5'-nucleotidase [Erysipelothrix sp.]
MEHLKKLTILHSNDMHGDFLEKDVDGVKVGGISMLSGYVSDVRQENENAIYVIAGDMFRGSVIDSEYRGMSTIEIVNILSPDVVTLGNHEVDYGLAHLLFVEKCANFPIINANMYITTNHKRLFDSHIILEVDGMNILFIGILTEEVIASTKLDPLIGAIVDVEEAAKEVGKICNSYKTVDIDFTVLLTHIGLDQDIELAKNLDERWGVDLIIGAHSHTFMDEAIEVNGIPIAQAGEGTSQVGRFDIIVNTDTNDIHEYTWSCVPINEETSHVDEHLEKIVQSYKDETDRKYNRVITRFVDEYTHPIRNEETELGKLFADAIKDSLGVDLVFLGSGSIRDKQLGPIVLYQDLLKIFPFNDELHRIYVTGAQLKKSIKHILRDESFENTTEFYQFSRGLRIEYHREPKDLVSVSLKGVEIKDDDTFTLALQDYHLKNIEDFLNLKLEDVSDYKKPKLLSANSTDLIEEYLTHHDQIRVLEDKRLIIK